MSMDIPNGRLSVGQSDLESIKIGASAQDAKGDGAAENVGFIVEDGGCCQHNNKLALAAKNGGPLPLFAQFLRSTVPNSEAAANTVDSVGKSLDITTMAIGEEDDGHCVKPPECDDRPGISTLALGEEDDGQCVKPPVCDDRPDISTMALGEEDDGNCVKPPVCEEPPVTTFMVGEEDDCAGPPIDRPVNPFPDNPVATTLMVGEEDDVCLESTGPTFGSAGDFFASIGGGDTSDINIFEALFGDFDQGD